MLLQFANGDSFAIGAAPFAYRSVANDPASLRIALTVSIGDFEMTAILDTGGVYLLCAPEVAEHLHLDPQNGIRANPLRWRGERLEGTLYVVPLTLQAAEGESLQLEVTAFIPQPELAQWSQDFQCVLGMYGCLEKMRFAVDPNDDTFYFGALGQT